VTREESLWANLLQRVHPKPPLQNFFVHFGGKVEERKRVDAVN
jgi:hypothetical protein